MKKLMAVFILLVTFVFSAPASASENTTGLGITVADFIDKLGYACSRVSNGITEGQIEANMQINDDKNVTISFSSSIIILINRHKSAQYVRNVAVTYVFEDSDKSANYHDHGYTPDDEVIFSSICMQTVLALNKGMTVPEARELLKAIGLYGALLDGLQRSKKHNGNLYIMKLQPNGMAVMAVSHI